MEMSKMYFPLSKVYTLLEPGPVVLVTTAWGGKRNVMAMSWHTMLEFVPPLVGCVISSANYSFRLLDAGGECGINIPSEDLAEKVAGCGNSSGMKDDKFTRFGLTAVASNKIKAPLIDECFANLECVVHDRSMVEKYSLFVLRVVKAWIDPDVNDPRTIHHLGKGSFMFSGQRVKLGSKMR